MICMQDSFNLLLVKLAPYLGRYSVGDIHNNSEVTFLCDEVLIRFYSLYFDFSIPYSLIFFILSCHY